MPSQYPFPSIFPGRSTRSPGNRQVAGFSISTVPHVAAAHVPSLQCPLHGPVGHVETVYDRKSKSKKKKKSSAACRITGHYCACVLSLSHRQGRHAGHPGAWLVFRGGVSFRTPPCKDQGHGLSLFLEFCSPALQVLVALILTQRPPSSGTGHVGAVGGVQNTMNELVEEGFLLVS